MRWWLGVGLLYLAALALQSGLLAYATYVLAGMMLLSRLFARAGLQNLEASRDSMVATAEIGDTVAIAVTIHNIGTTPVPWVLVEDLLPERSLFPKPAKFKVEGKRLQVRLMKSRQKTKLRYEIECQMRGYFQIGPLVMESGDLFGLHRRYRVDTEPNYLTVFPKVVPLEGYDLASRRPIGDVRLMHRLFEDPTRIAGVRPYEAGDPLNRVHWGATARTGKLHSKLYEPSTLSGATFVLDFHEATYAKRGEPHRSELAITTVVSLANAVYLMGQQVGLVSNGRDAAERIRLEGWARDFRTRLAARQAPAMHARSERLQPLHVETRRGVEQFHRIRETLARIELAGGLAFPDLLLETADRMPRDATIVAVLPDVPVPAALALGNVRRQGYAISVILVMLDEETLEKAYGRLLAEGIRDVRHVKHEAEVPTLCQQQARLTTPYQVAVALD